MGREYKIGVLICGTSSVTRNFVRAQSEILCCCARYHYGSLVLVSQMPNDNGWGETNNWVDNYFSLIHMLATQRISSSLHYLSSSCIHTALFHALFAFHCP